jgi:hypothetical protein
MWIPILAIGGCLPEITKECIDMTNASSTYLGIVGGAAVDAVTTGGFIIDRTHTSTMTD